MKALWKKGSIVALCTGILTIFTFGIALFTPPISGPLAQNPITYPYLDILDRFPRDYLWMYPAMLLMLSYMVLAVILFYMAEQEKKIYAHLGMLFSVVGAVLLFVDYYVQVAVVQPSLLLGETDGISLLTQYNPHGIFVVLEEIGYSLMILSFLWFIPLFSRKDKRDGAIRGVLWADGILSIFAFVCITVIMGIQREYLFEVAIISIHFLALILFSFLVAGRFRAERR